MREGAGPGPPPHTYTHPRGAPPAAAPSSSPGPAGSPPPAGPTRGFPPPTVTLGRKLPDAVDELLQGRRHLGGWRRGRARWGRGGAGVGGGREGGRREGAVLRWEGGKREAGRNDRYGRCRAASQSGAADEHRATRRFRRFGGSRENRCRYSNARPEVAIPRRGPLRARSRDSAGRGGVTSRWRHHSAPCRDPAGPPPL